MKEQITITIKSGNDLEHLHTYAIKTIDGILYIGYYNDNKKSFRTNEHTDIPIENISVYASLEALQNKMILFN